MNVNQKPDFLNEAHDSMKLHKSIGSDTKNKQTHLTQKETRMHIFNLFHIYKQSNDLLSTHLFVTPIMLSRIKSIYFFGNFFFAFVSLHYLKR